MSAQSAIFNPSQTTSAATGDGFSVPRLTTTGRLAIAFGTGDSGMMVYDTTLNNLFIWTGSAWESVPASGDAGINGAVQYNDNGVVSGATNFVYNKVNQKVGIGTITPNVELDVVGNASITGAATVGTTLGVTGVSTFAAGTILLPALTTTGDTNTGIYYPAADTFAVTTGGNERYRVDSTGMGIGMLPTSKLTVNGEINVPDNFALRLGSNQAGGATLLYNGSGNLDITPRSGFHTKLVDGNLIIGTSGKGIDFSATANSSGTMTSELLNDYEEGTFVPTIVGLTTAGVGVYTAQNGKYTKVGNLVTCQIYLSWTAHTGTGDMRIGGLPFATASTSGIYHAATIGFASNITLTVGYIMTAYALDNSSTLINLNQYPSGGGASTSVPIDVSGSIIISVTYLV